MSVLVFSPNGKFITYGNLLDVTTWYASESVNYLVTTSHTISTGVTVTINELSTIEFIDNGSITLTGDSTLSIAGTLLYAGKNKIFNITSGTVTLTSTCKVEYVLPEWWGAQRDGSTNDCAAISYALGCGKDVKFLSGVYAVERPADSVYALRPSSNTRITFDPGTEIRAIGSFENYPVTDLSCMFYIVGLDRVVIDGNFALINMDNGTITYTGEQNHAVIISSNSVVINNLRAWNAGGDGFYIGRQTFNNVTYSAYKVVLNNCYSDANRRQGLSIVSCNGCWINGGIYSGTSGTAPQYGIDIEPDSYLDTLMDININGVQTNGNTGGSISIVPMFLTCKPDHVTAQQDNETSIMVSNITSIDDGNGSGNPIIMAAGPADYGKKLRGKISIDNITIIRPCSSGIGFRWWPGNGNAPIVEINNVTVIDPGNGLTDAAAARYRSGAYVGAIDQGLNDSVLSTGKFIMSNVRVIDTRTPVVTYAAMFLESAAIPTAVPVQYFKTRDVYCDGFVSTSGGYDVVLPITVEGIVHKGIDVSFSENCNYVKSITTGPIYAIFNLGRLLRLGSNDIVVTLPKASSYIGAKYRFRCTNHKAWIITPATGDRIDLPGIGVSEALVIDTPHMEIELQTNEDDSTIWYITYLYLPWKSLAGSPVGAEPHRFIGKTVWNSAANQLFISASTGTTSDHWIEVGAA